MSLVYLAYIFLTFPVPFLHFTFPLALPYPKSHSSAWHNTPFLFPHTAVPGKPGVPDIVDWDVDRVDLKWEAPKDNGGAPITKYIIEKKERYGTWETIHESEVS